MEGLHSRTGDGMISSKLLTAGGAGFPAMVHWGEYLPARDDTNKTMTYNAAGEFLKFDRFDNDRRGAVLIDIYGKPTGLAIGKKWDSGQWPEHIDAGLSPFTDLIVVSYVARATSGSNKHELYVAVVDPINQSVLSQRSFARGDSGSPSSNAFDHSILGDDGSVYFTCSVNGNIGSSRAAGGLAVQIHPDNTVTWSDTTGRITSAPSGYTDTCKTELRVGNSWNDHKIVKVGTQNFVYRQNVASSYDFLQYSTKTYLEIAGNSKLHNTCWIAASSDSTFGSFTLQEWTSVMSADSSMGLVTDGCIGVTKTGGARITRPHKCQPLYDVDNNKLIVALPSDSEAVDMGDPNGGLAKRGGYILQIDVATKSLDFALSLDVVPYSGQSGNVYCGETPASLGVTPCGEGIHVTLGDGIIWQLPRKAFTSRVVDNPTGDIGIQKVQATDATHLFTVTEQGAIGAFVKYTSGNTSDSTGPGTNTYSSFVNNNDDWWDYNTYVQSPVLEYPQTDPI